jgi:hypothetical protein
MTGVKKKKELEEDAGVFYLYMHYVQGLRRTLEELRLHDKIKFIRNL